MHPHFMKDEDEFNWFLSKTIKEINELKPNYIFICSEDEKIKGKFIKHLHSSINLINPICKDISVPLEYLDFFALTLCSEVYMCCKFSTFSIMASIIGNIPIISYNYNTVIENRYKAKFIYKLGFDNVEYFKIAKKSIVKKAISVAKRWKQLIIRT